MRWFLLLALLVVVLCLTATQPVSACPACREAVAASSDSGDTDDDDPANSAAAYNYSIYLMVGVPYLLLTVVVFGVYRGLKKNAEYLRTRGKSAADVLLSTNPASAP